MPGQWEPGFRASSGYDNEPYDIDDVGCIAETDKAILCHLPDGEEEWFPLKLVWVESEVQAKGDVGTLSICPWLARKKNFLD